MKLTVCMLVKNEEFFIDLPIKSTLNIADEYVIVHDGEVKDRTEEIAKELCGDKLKFIVDMKNNGHFGKQRQMCLDNASGDWILWMDADECIDYKLEYFIKNALTDDIDIECFHLRYQHFINDFIHLDNSEPLHMGSCRLYKNKKDIDLTDRVTHALPKLNNFNKITLLEFNCIWHLGYMRGIEKIWERYERNMKRSTIHQPHYQPYWREWHFIGEYPTYKISPEDIPEIIRKKFHIGLNIKSSREMFGLD